MTTYLILVRNLWSVVRFGDFDPPDSVLDAIYTASLARRPIGEVLPAIAERINARMSCLEVTRMAARHEANKQREAILQLWELQLSEVQ
jgi:hypothetical protein